LRVINGQRGKLALFKLDDKTAMIEATADEAVLNANRHLLKDDELVIVQCVLQPDRFSGGFRLKVTQVWDLETARCKFGKYLRVTVASKAPDFARMARDFPPRLEASDLGDVVRGLPVRLSLTRPVDFAAGSGSVCAELMLGDKSKFLPTDAALASWMAQAGQRQAEIVYE
jgi:DNA polymerase-3 subunit alpha